MIQQSHSWAYIQGWGEMYPYVHSSTIHNSQVVETTQMSINRWMDKEDVVHMYNEIFLSHKREQNNAICSNMDGPRDCYAEWSKSDTKRQILYDVTYMQNQLKVYKYFYLFIYHKYTHGCRKQTYGCQGNQVGKEILGDLDWHIHTTIYKID